MWARTLSLDGLWEGLTVICAKENTCSRIGNGKGKIQDLSAALPPLDCDRPFDYAQDVEMMFAFCGVVS
jgi:hypothetical protein